LEHVGDEGATALHNLYLETLAVEKEVADLKGKYLEALALSLKEIDGQSLNELTGEFEKISKTLDGNLLKLKAGFFESFTQGTNNDALEQIGNDYKHLQDRINAIKKDVSLSDADKSKGIDDLIKYELQRISEYREALQKSPNADDHAQEIKALGAE